MRLSDRPFPAFLLVMMLIHIHMSDRPCKQAIEQRENFNDDPRFIIQDISNLTVKVIIVIWTFYSEQILMSIKLQETIKV